MKYGLPLKGKKDDPRTVMHEGERNMREQIHSRHALVVLNYVLGLSEQARVILSHAINLIAK